MRKWFRRIALAAALSGGALVAAQPTGAEARRVERLIEAVAAQPRAQFIRNGRAHPPADAARFLREKLQARGEGVHTAEDFIERIASRSSTTGRAYLVRQADGQELPLDRFLRAELARIDAAR